MTNKIKPIVLSEIRRVISDMNVPAIAKLNQFAFQHVCMSFNKERHIVPISSPVRHEWYRLDVVNVTESFSVFLGLNMAQRTVVQEFLRKLYEGFHMGMLCPDFVQHWEAEGLEIAPYMPQEPSKTFGMLMEHEQTHSKPEPMLPNFEELPDVLRNFFGRLSRDPVMKTQDSWGSAIEAELDYLAHNPEIDPEQMYKLTDLLQSGKYDKYAKRMKKYGVKMLNFKVKKGEVVLVKGKKIEQIDLGDSLEEAASPISIMERHYSPRQNLGNLEVEYLNEGILYEAPLSFDKFMAKIMFQINYKLISEESALEQTKTFLKGILGDKLAKDVKVELTPEGIALKAKAQGFMAAIISQQVTSKLANTYILN